MHKKIILIFVLILLNISIIGAFEIYKCEKCNIIHKDNYLFCPNCGTKILIIENAIFNNEIDSASIQSLKFEIKNAMDTFYLNDYIKVIKYSILSDSSKTIIKELFFYNTSDSIVKIGEKNYRQNKFDSEYIICYSDGKLKVHGNYIFGNKNGLWKRFYDNGNLAEQVNYENDQETGIAISYYENKQISTKLNYISGKRFGNATWYHENGNVESELNYINNKRNGIYYAFNNLGNIIGDGYFEKDSGVCIQKYDNGNVNYKLELKNGIGKRFYYFENGNLSHNIEINNLENHGSFISYHNNKEISLQTNFTNGKINGAYTSFYENGQKYIEGNFDYGFKIGEWKEYYDNGKIKYKIFYLPNKSELFFYEYIYAKWSDYLSFQGYDENEITWLFWHIELEKSENNENLNITGNCNFELYDTAGQLIAKGHFLDGTGACTTYFQDTKIKTVSHYLNYEKNGSFKELYDSGIVKGKCQYQKDKKNGLSESFYSNGRKAAYIEYKNDIQEGSYKSWYESGKNMSDGYFSNGKIESLTGELKKWYESGKIKQEIKANNGEGYRIDYYENGNKEEYKKYIKGILNGEQLEWYETGKIRKQEFYINDKKNGVYKEWYENNNLKISAQYIENLRNGEYFEYYENGNKKIEGNFESGNGKLKNYDEKLNLLEIINFKIDKKYGEYNSFYENGNIKIKCFYDVNEKCNGEYTFYNEDGSIFSIDEYENGNIIKSINYFLEYWNMLSDAEESIEKNAYNDAEEKLNKALKYNSKGSAAYFKLGNIYFERYKYDKAINYFEKSIEYDTSEPAYYFNIAAANFNLRYYSAALDYYYQAANKYLDLGDRNKALQCLDNMKKIDSDFFLVNKLLYKIYTDNITDKENKILRKNSGTGFIISNNGIMVTNFHVIKQGEKISAYIPNKNQEFECKMILNDQSNDIAILKLLDYNDTDIYKFKFLKNEHIKAGTKVYTIGYPLNFILGEKPKLSDGIVNSIYGLNDDPRLLQINNSLQPGNSGGPLFNESGELLGIVLASLNAKLFFEKIDILPQNINFAIKIDYLKNLLSLLPESGEIFKNASKVSQVSLQNLVEKITKNIVLIKCYTKE